MLRRECGERTWAIHDYDRAARVPDKVRRAFSQLQCLGELKLKLSGYFSARCKAAPHHQAREGVRWILKEKNSSSAGCALASTGSWPQQRGCILPCMEVYRLHMGI
ncbi:hypothetical protein M8818_003631 [Zalaria obscura]|uniref:Uncharacterized protein n=1 Tax=Zalaria obscura TaxID=2024903 RepID=A0ACC3SEI3_9PEZI